MNRLGWTWPRDRRHVCQELGWCPMPGKFVLRKVKTGYHFTLKAKNGETIAQSEVWSSNTSAKQGHRVGSQERPGRQGGRPDRE